MTPPRPAPWRTLEATTAAEPRRADVWLAGALEGLSRRQAQAMIARGAVTVNGRPCSKSRLVSTGDEVEIWEPPTTRRFGAREDPNLPLGLHHVEEDFAVVEKQSGVPSVPLTPEERGTLAGAVVARFPECREVGRRAGDGGLVQRLDKETSGAVLVARSQPVHDLFVEQQRAGRVEKTYLALVLRGSTPLPGVIDAPLGAAGPGGHEMRVEKDGRAARTRLEVVAEGRRWMLVKARIRHGVRHQIRVHLASAGYPIAGDPAYGPGERPPALERLFLHAHEIAFARPRGGGRLVIASPLPPELERALKEI